MHIAAIDNNRIGCTRRKIARPKESPPSRLNNGIPLAVIGLALRLSWSGFNEQTFGVEEQSSCGSRKETFAVGALSMRYAGGSSAPALVGMKELPCEPNALTVG